MGIHLNLKSRLPNANLHKRISPQEALESLNQTFSAAAYRSTCEDIAENHYQASFQIHPAAPPVYVELIDHVVSISAKTSPAGPGYHHQLTTLLDHLAETQGFQWQSHNSGDDTNYFTTRDPQALQDAFLQEIKTLANQFSKDDSYTSIYLAPTPNLAPTTKAHTLTSTGPLEQKDWQTINKDPQANARLICPAWDVNPTPQNALTEAQAFLTIEYSFDPPLNQLDHPILTRIHQALFKANIPDLHSQIPFQTWNQIAPHVESNPQILTEIKKHCQSHPESHASGYRQSPLVATIANAFQLTIPGTMRSLPQTEDSPFTLINHQSEIQVNAYPHNPQMLSSARESYPCDQPFNFPFPSHYWPHPDDPNTFHILAEHPQLHLILTFTANIDSELIHLQKTAQSLAPK